jgi:hypothetical protein
MNITRRTAIQIVAAASAVTGLYGGYHLLKKSKNIVDPLYPFVKPNIRWSTYELSEFLKRLKVSEQNLILTSLGKKDSEIYDVAQIKKDVLWLASNITTYPFKNKNDYNYHEDIMKWLAKEYNVEERYALAGSTFILERKILDSIFIQIWDKLTPEQRKQILTDIDKEDKLRDKAGIAMAGGAVALTALSATIYFTGFAFYTTLSTMICASASFFGLTLPFAAYAGTSTTMAVLSGPVGWAILGLAALGSTVFLGRANHAKTAAFVTQLHLLKVQVLKNSNMLDKVLEDLALK